MSQPTSSAGNDNTGALLLVAEYQAVRSEIVESFKLTQSIVQWSLAIFGVGFGAGFVALTGTNIKEFIVKLAVFLVFGVLLPGLMWAASWHWLGEMRRMERAGRYLRGLEFALGDSPVAVGQSKLSRPLNWERSLVDHKGWLPYLPVAALFAGTFLVSVIVAVAWFFHVFEANAWVVISYVVISVVYAGASAYMGVRIGKMAKERYDFASMTFEPWPATVSPATNSGPV